MPTTPVTFQDNGAEYRVVRHDSAYGPNDGMWELGIYTGDGLSGDVATFDIRRDPGDYSDDELIAMAKSVLAQVADGTW